MCGQEQGAEDLGCSHNPDIYDYTTDANALREAEQKLSEGQQVIYVNRLIGVWNDFINQRQYLGKNPERPPDCEYWLLCRCPLSTRARILSEVIEGEVKT
jgi:hypothetical protein